jgi:hypothetical protein
VNFRGQKHSFLKESEWTLFQLIYCYSSSCMERGSSHAAWSNAYHYKSIFVHPCISFVVFQTPRIALIKFTEFKTCSEPSSVLCVVKLYCFIKYKSRLCTLTLDRVPCGRNGVDSFVVGKKISNIFLGFSDSKFQTIFQDISTE